ncbi:MULTISPECIES: hypothetical protein [unclassified Sphingopyxis]|uniref:hypothetical protein n=1 Tax=unclassified Sphingopyxis TaxID=2614943 RepID=UPI00073BBB88|nr:MULTISPECIES: hypothetical protein [unclassified Sphingopyxis]KTE42937.1 hypothetical protein ATE62_04275 [Sphingopyxis sp. HIX]
MLSGCMGVGSGSLDFDSSVRNAPGTITLGDTKVYSREMLINERAADIAWIDRLITASEDPTKTVFQPTLIREMEQISAFAAALGARFDPAAGVSYRRSNETGEILQEIDVLKAKVALSQVRRDIEIIEAGFPTQTVPVNTGLGTLGTGGALTTGAAMTPPDAAQVAATVNALISSVTARLDAAASPIAKTDAKSNPADDFRDRLAYRDMLKAARNAAGLDELHDAGNNRLIRLNLQATVVPDPDNARALGAIQVEIAASTSGGTAAYLGSWLRAANARGDWRVDTATFKPNNTLDTLEDSGDFARTRIGSFLTVMPVLVNESGVELAPQDLFDRAEWTKDDVADNKFFGSLLAELSLPPAEMDAAVAKVCQPGSLHSFALDIADARTKSYDLIRSANLSAGDLGVQSPGMASGAKYQRAGDYQKQVFGLIRNRPDCAALVARYAPDKTTWRVLQRPDLGGAEQVRIYEVGPREQAQQVSTVARSANSLALAVSLAASAPSAGVAGNLGAGFRRDIMNRASALDRVPQVVGYSVGGKKKFGWVIGPHATTNAKGQAEVRQVAKSYDLSVDLSVPAWWTSLKLKAMTVWAPSPQKLVSGTLGAPGSETDLTVPLTSAADFQSFTQFLVRDSKRAVALEDVIGGPVTGCAATTLLLKGPNLWRAERVMLLGLSLGRDAFVIAPDMAGIIVTVPAVSAIPGERAYQLDDQVHILTPLGPASKKFEYDASLSGENCKPKPAAASDADDVTVTKAEPTTFVVPSLVEIDVTGKNLGKIDEIRLDGRRATTAKVSADGKLLTVEFSRHTSEGIEQGTVKLEFFVKKKSVGTAQTIRITRE